MPRSWIDSNALAEGDLSATFSAYGDSHQSAWRYFGARPWTTARVLAGLSRLDALTASPSTTPSGAFLRESLPWNRRLTRAFTHRSLLEIPRDAAEYSLGASRQTLRRKARQAEQQGVTWAAVDDPAERQRIFELARRWEATQHADDSSVPDNADLFTFDHWLAAYTSDGEPIMLAVTPIDSDWSVLRYFRIIGEGPAQSVARYLMMRVLVEELSARGVKYLVDPVPPLQLPNGQRHFQRMVGFRIHRVSAP